MNIFSALGDLEITEWCIEGNFCGWGAHEEPPKLPFEKRAPWDSTFIYVNFFFQMQGKSIFYFTEKAIKIGLVIR